jgi:hypothetical protein
MLTQANATIHQFKQHPSPLLQVWVSLLRVTQIEPRKGLMREVLDCLVPTLVDKLGTRGEDGKVIWVRCGCSVLVLMQMFVLEDVETQTTR